MGFKWTDSQPIPNHMGSFLKFFHDFGDFAIVFKGLTLFPGPRTLRECPEEYVVRLAATSQDYSQLVGTCLDLSQLVQTCRNLSELVGTSRNSCGLKGWTRGPYT